MAPVKPENNPGDAARDAYDVYASVYDYFNQGYMYERWTGRLLAAAEAAGAQGHRLLDVGCGTGLSFLPMLDRGWTVTACDISPAMVDIARDKVGNRATLLTADMRQLPPLGHFDLVWAVNDAVNYLMSGDELTAALKGMRRNLASGGTIVFDMNTLATYRTFFSSEFTREADGRHFTWRGLMSPHEIEPGSVSEGHFSAKADPRLTHVHRQRHFAEPEVKSSIREAGLLCSSVLGELNGDLEPGLDEDRHTKAVYVAVHR